MTDFRIVLCSVLFLASCTGSVTGSGDGPYSEDTSSSGAAAMALGGALSASGPNGLVAFHRPKFFDLSLLPRAWASTECPTYRSTSSDCSVSTTTMWLDLNSCEFPAQEARWNGPQALIKSSGNATCGVFPDPGANQSLRRQFVTAPSSTTPGSATVRSEFGTTATVDHASANLSNFDGDVIAAIVNGGYGMEVDFDGTGARSAITLGYRMFSTGFDHSVTGDLTISEIAGDSDRTVSGTLTIYLNTVRVVGTATLTNVIHTDNCCQPVLGTISTTFAAGDNVAPTAVGTAMVGKTETLEFKGCGKARLTTFGGLEKDVALSRCF